MMKRWIALLLLAVMLCGLWAVPASAATYATVVGGWLRLRVNPSYDAVIIPSYKSGSVVTVISQSAGWARVLTSDYRLGYMDTHYLLMEGGTPPSPSTPVPSTRTWTTVNRVAYVTSQNGKGVRLRSAPEVNKYNVMGLYPVGRTVTEIKVSSDGWSYIKIDQKYGYMMSQFLTTWHYGPVDTPVPPPPEKTSVPVGPGLSGVQLNNLNPKVGDTLKLTVKPEGTKYSVVWYRADTKVLLSTGNSYTVTSADVGSAITVRVTGSDGTVAEVSTSAVKAASSKTLSVAEEAKTLETVPLKEPEDVKTQTGTETVEIKRPVESSKTETEDTEKQKTVEIKIPADSTQTSQESTEDIPDFVRRTLEQGDIVAQPVDSASESSGDSDF